LILIYLIGVGVLTAQCQQSCVGHNEDCTFYSDGPALGVYWQCQAYNGDCYCGYAEFCNCYAANGNCYCDNSRNCTGSTANGNCYCGNALQCSCVADNGFFCSQPTTNISGGGGTYGSVITPSGCCDNTTSCIHVESTSLGIPLGKILGGTLGGLFGLIGIPCILIAILKQKKKNNFWI